MGTPMAYVQCVANEQYWATIMGYRAGTARVVHQRRRSASQKSFGEKRAIPTVVHIYHFSDHLLCFGHSQDKTG